MPEPLHPRRHGPLPSHPGAVVDHTVGTLLLDTLTPLALEVALTVQTELETRAAETDALRRQAVERARHRAGKPSNALATAPTSPAATTWPSTPTTGSSPTASKPIGTTRCAPCRPPARITNASPPPKQPHSPTT